MFNDLETREKMIQFIQEQYDVEGNKIINEIDKRPDFQSSQNKTMPDPKNIEGNVFFTGD